jgi:Secretion system C-terminal sorting domain
LLGSSYASNAQFASVQVIHNCADAAVPTVDIWAGNTLLINDLNFRSASATFTNIAAGTNIVIGVAPSTSTSQAQSIANFTVNFASGSKNIVVADGIVSSSGYIPGNTTAGFTLNSYTMALSAAPNGTTTSLLVHHGSTDAPTVDIVAPFTGVNPFLPNVLVNNAPYGAFAGYVNLPTANYKIQVRDQNSENVVAEYSAPLQTLGVGGAALTVIASGFLTPANNSNSTNTFGLYVATTAGGTLIPLPSTTITSTRLQAIHNSADAAAASVDVYLQSAATGTAAIRIIDNFAFRTASPYIDVPVGQVLTLSVAAPTSTSAAGAIATATYNLASSSKYQLIASGLVSPTGYSPSSTVAPFNLAVNTIARERSLNAINTDVLVYHGATDAPTVGVSATGAGQLITNMSYGQFASGGYLQLATNTPAGNYTLNVTNALGTSTIVTYNAPLNTLGTTGLGLTVVASGFLTPTANSNGPAFGLWVSLPAGGNLIPLSLITTSINEKTKDFVNASIAPNPANDVITLTVNSQNTQQSKINITDVTGKLIMSLNSDLTVGINNVKISLEDFTSGIYFITINNGNTVEYGKIIKQ